MYCCALFFIKGQYSLICYPGSVIDNAQNAFIHDPYGFHTKRNEIVTIGIRVTDRTCLFCYH